MEYTADLSTNQPKPGSVGAELGAVDQPGPEDKERLGWNSPRYNISRSVQLSPATMTSNRCVGFFQDASEVESYRLLRTQVLHRIKSRGGNTLMVSSSVPGEGKTLTAINLAFTFAKEFKQTVLLVDCDLRKQRIHEYLGYASDTGLIDYLLDDKPVSDLITWPGIEKLTIISGGRTTTGSSELLGSPRMKELVEDMKARYPDRIIIFDVPPILSAADALAFAPIVDHVMIVVRAGNTPMPEVKKSLQLLPQEKVIGLVLNRQRAGADKYQRYYNEK
jgi:non-specific protein-tyrosine kinase